MDNSMIDHNVKGFTLIELMIVVVIIGIISAIAFPSYIRYVERTQMNDGRAGLVIAAQALERCYVTNMSYAQCPLPNAIGGEARSPEEFFRIQVQSPGQGYCLKAQGRAGRVVGQEITLNQAGTPCVAAGS